MSKRIGFVVLTSIQVLKLALLSYYLFHASSKMCFAVVRKLELYDGDNSLLHPSVSHMMKIKPFENQPKEEHLIPIDAIMEKLLLLQGNKNHLCVARLSNLYGQCF